LQWKTPYCFVRYKNLNEGNFLENRQPFITLAYKNTAFLGVKKIMAKLKEYKRLLVFCLVVFILCDGTSFARRGGGRCGPPAGRRGGSYARRGASRCGPPAGRRGSSFARRGRSRCGPPAGRRCGPSRGRAATCPQPQPIIVGLDYGYPYYDYDGYYSRYDVLYPPPQVQSLQAQGNTYNYCTFNYFNGTEDSATQNNPSAYHQRQLPQKTEVGIFYGDGVTAFKNGDYAEAAKNFQRAMRQANKFMPFAYVQALFADEDYAEATEQLRLALDKLSPESDRILFPIFLYPSDQILLTQIEKLREQAGSDSDLQLVVGYQLFGVKKMDEAVEFLNKAKSNSVNELAATKLLLIIEKTKTTTNRSRPPAHKTTSYT
jgi:hypothetical protein